MNRQRLSGFSLMEMMVVLLIVSIVAAASAPMVNRKMVADAVGGCKWGQNGNTIFYNGEGQVRTVAIGTQNAGAGNPRLHIASDNEHPHIRLTNGASAANIRYVNTSTLFTTANPTVAGSVIIGPGANSAHERTVSIGLNSKINEGANSTVAIGAGATVQSTAEAPSVESVALGYGATVNGHTSTALGSHTRAAGTYDGTSTFGYGTGATAVGSRAWAVGNYSTALGYDAKVRESAANAIAVGRSARANSTDAIAIGRADIPTNAANAIAIGLGSSADSADAIAIGNTAGALGTGATALGSVVTASAVSSTALGSGSTSAANGSLTIGGATILDTNAINSIAIGSTASSAASNSISIGRQASTFSQTQTTFTDSIAIGNGTWTLGNCTIALGTSASANGSQFSDGSVRSIAIGTAAKAHDTGAVAIGGSAYAAGVSSIAIGAPQDYETTKKVKKYQYDYYNVDYQGAHEGWKTAKCEDYGINPELQQQNPDIQHALPGMEDTTAEAGIKPPATCSITYYKKTMVYDSKQSTGDKDAWLEQRLDYKAYQTWDDDPDPHKGKWKVNMDDTKPPTGVLCNEEEIEVDEPTTATGFETQATGNYSIAIGPGAVAANDNAVAIGKGATTLYDNDIVLGDANSTVYIPGKLIVAGNTYLATRINSNHKNASYIFMGLGNDSTDDCTPEKGTVLRYIKAGAGGGDPDKDGPVRFGDGGNWLPQTGYDSDRRLKNVGEAFKAGLEEIKKLELFHYTYKKDSKKTPHVGVMAQDLMKIFPDAVWKGEDGFYRIRMEDMFYALVNAVKELDAKIEALKNNEIAELRKRVDDLEKVNAKLAKQNEKIVEQNKKLEKRINALERKVK